jgi:hypothetical protein
VAVQEEQRGESLVLGGSGDAAVDGEGAQEPGDLRRSHLGGMTLVVKEQARFILPMPDFLRASTIHGIRRAAPMWRCCTAR